MWGVFWVLVRKTPRKQNKSLMTSVSSKRWNCSWLVLSCHSQVKQTGVGLTLSLHYWLLLLFIYYYVACPCDWTLSSGDPPSPQSVHCLTLWIEWPLVFRLLSQAHCLQSSKQFPLTSPLEMGTLKLKTFSSFSKVIYIGVRWEFNITRANPHICYILKSHQRGPAHPDCF